MTEHGYKFKCKKCGLAFPCPCIDGYLLSRPPALGSMRVDAAELEGDRLENMRQERFEARTTTDSIVEPPTATPSLRIESLEEPHPDPALLQFIDDALAHKNAELNTLKDQLLQVTAERDELRAQVGRRAVVASDVETTKRIAELETALRQALHKWQHRTWATRIPTDHFQDRIEIEDLKKLIQ